MDVPRASHDGGFIAREVDLGASSRWWAQPDTPPPAFQNRRDILFEIEESTTSKRGGKTTVSKDVFVLFQDYSKTHINAQFDTQAVDDVKLSQQHAPPPDKLRQDQLEDAHTRFGRRIAGLVGGKEGSVVGDATPQGLVLDLLGQLPGALLPVGTRAYGALVYQNRGNATVEQYDEIRPGDIVSFRNSKFQGKHGNLHTKYSHDVGKPDHVGVVAEWDGTKKKIRAWEQGKEDEGLGGEDPGLAGSGKAKDKGKKKGGKVKVKQESFRLEDLRSGEVRVWRVMGRGWVGWDDSAA
jgi:myosin tail region-interacting protein MTI1